MVSVLGEGGIAVKIIADSITKGGVRLTTMQLRYHRFIHGEFMTHRMFSRNAASSRAIPVSKMIAQVDDTPATPIHWGLNKPGMQADAETDETEWATRAWLQASYHACNTADDMVDRNLHKQVVNRILEPFQFMETVVTATEWDNFFALRTHSDAQPEIQELARCMHEAQNNSEPVVRDDSWHLPYVSNNELGEMHALDVAIKCSAARCARVSYLNHDNSKPSIEKDIALYDMLATRPFDDGKGHVLGDDDPVHLSPLEHQAGPIDTESLQVFPKGVTHIDKEYTQWSGNFRGWIQYRQLI